MNSPMQETTYITPYQARKLRKQLRDDGYTERRREMTAPWLVFMEYQKGREIIHVERYDETSYRVYKFTR